VKSVAMGINTGAPLLVFLSEKCYLGIQILVQPLLVFLNVKAILDSNSVEKLLCWWTVVIMESNSIEKLLICVDAGHVIAFSSGQ
jgi:hypothetical protein